MTGISGRRLFREMLVEEWRMHAELFGGRRFAAFPLFVLILVAGGVELLRVTGTSLDATVAGLHALVFVVGMQTGTAGLVGRDTLRGLLDGVTLLLFAARTLPVSRRRLLAVFLVKDLVFYAGLVLFPVTLALAPAAARGLVAPTLLPRVFAGLVGVFAMGLVVTLMAIALRSRGHSGNLVLLGIAVVVGLGHAAGVDLVALTPYALVARPLSLPAVAVAFLPTLALGVVGALGFQGTGTRPALTAENVFARWHARLGDRDGLLTKTLLDVARSGGGFWKVAFSAVIVLLVAVVLVEFAGVVTGRAPAPGVSLGAILGLTAFTTYNWLTQFDGPGTYRALPVSTPAVFRAKFRAFLLLGPATGLVLYAIALAWLGTTLVDGAVGAILLAGLQVYLYGLTVYLAGLQPSEFLFDTVLFAAFTLAVAVVLVPVLVAGFALALGPAVVAGLLAASLVAGGVGYALVRRAGPRWGRRYREGVAG